MGTISKLTKEELQQKLEEGSSYGEILESLGLRAAGGNYRSLKQQLAKFDLDLTEFREKRILQQTAKVRDLSAGTQPSLEDVLIENSKYPRKSVKRRLIADKLLTYICAFCGQDGTWKEKKLVLILDHINGIWNDNRLENLRFLCPNCNSQTDTFAGRNK